MRDPGSIPRGVHMWNRDSSVSIVSLHWWPRRYWLLWPCLRRASSQTVTRPSCRQCDKPTWSHTALLPPFHSHWRPSFRLHNIVGCWGGSPVESLQSHSIYTHSHWSSGSTLCFPSWGTRVPVQSPGEYLCGTGILLLALSCYSTQHNVTKCLFVEDEELVNKQNNQLPTICRFRFENNLCNSDDIFLLKPYIFWNSVYRKIFFHSCGKFERKNNLSINLILSCEPVYQILSQNLYSGEKFIYKILEKLLRINHVKQMKLNESVVSLLTSLLESKLLFRLILSEELNHSNKKWSFVIIGDFLYNLCLIKLRIKSCRILD